MLAAQRFHKRRVDADRPRAISSNEPLHWALRICRLCQGHSLPLDFLWATEDVLRMPRMPESELDIETCRRIHATDQAVARRNR